MAEPGTEGQDYNDGHGPPEFMDALGPPINPILTTATDTHDVALILLAVTSKALAEVAQGIAEISEILMNEDDE